MERYIVQSVKPTVLLRKTKAKSATKKNSHNHDCIARYVQLDIKRVTPVITELIIHYFQNLSFLILDNIVKTQSIERSMK